MCALLVGLPDVTVIGVDEWPRWLRVVVETPTGRPGCGCGGVVHRHGIREVEFVDLPVFGRPTRLAWRKQRWRCTSCGRCWCDDVPGIAATLCALTTRAARWSTLHVGRNGRAVSDVARELGCGRHTVMDAVVAIGEQLVDHHGPDLRRHCARSRRDPVREARSVPDTVVVDPDRRRAPRPAPRCRGRAGLHRSRVAGSPRDRRCGGIGSSGRPLICRTATAACSTRCSPGGPGR